MAFKKGYDANRYVPTNSGLTAFHEELGALLRKQSLDAVSFMINTMNNPQAALALRMKAAQEILDRGIGRPVDRTVVATLEDKTEHSAEKLTTEELEAIVAKMAINEGVIDAEFIEVSNDKT